MALPNGTTDNNTNTTVTINLRTNEETNPCSILPASSNYKPDSWLHIEQTVTILIILFGSVGNLLSIIVLRRQEFSGMTTKVYLVTLATVDLLCLDIVMMSWLLEFFGIHAILWHDFMCKLWAYIPFVLFGLSYWTQVVVSIDRCVATTFPIKYRTIKNTHRRFVVAGIVVFYSLFQSPELFYHNLVKNGTACEVVDVGYRYYAKSYWPWIHLVVSFFAPLTVMIICSVIMIRHLSATGIAAATSHRTDDILRKTTKLFILLNVVFITTNSSYHLVILLDSFGVCVPVAGHVFHGIKILHFVNHAVNFLLYVVHMPKFCVVLRVIFRRAPRNLVTDEGGDHHGQVRYSKTTVI